MNKKILHILRQKPDKNQKAMIASLCSKNECLYFNLFERDEEKDYEDLIDRIFEYDKVINWW
jgi:hypothetical protein